MNSLTMFIEKWVVKMQNINSNPAVLVLGKIIMFFCILGLILNILFPIYEDTFWNHHALQFIIEFFWVYALLCNKGFFKKRIGERENGIIEYSVSVPIVQICVVRILEFLSFIFSHSRKVLWSHYFVLILADIVYIALQLVDKMNYYYIGIPSSEDEEGLYDD